MTQQAPTARAFTVPTIPAWMAYAATAAVCWGVWGVLSKGPSRELSGWMTQVLFTFALAPSVALACLSKRVFVGTNRPLGLFWGFVSGLLAAAGNIFFYLALEGRADTSIAVTLTNIYPLVTIVIARKPFDPIWHADGMICWLGARSVLVNGYWRVGDAFRRRVRRSLGRHKIDLVEMPYEPQAGGREGMPTAAENWMNFLRVRDLLIVLRFGMRSDDRAIGTVKDMHHGCGLASVDCRDEEDRGGGSVGLSTVRA